MHPVHPLPERIILEVSFVSPVEQVLMIDPRNKKAFKTGRGGWTAVANDANTRPECLWSLAA